MAKREAHPALAGLLDYFVYRQQVTKLFAAIPRRNFEEILDKERARRTLQLEALDEVVRGEIPGFNATQLVEEMGIGASRVIRGNPFLLPDFASCAGGVELNRLAGSGPWMFVSPSVDVPIAGLTYRFGFAEQEVPSVIAAADSLDLEPARVTPGHLIDLLRSGSDSYAKLLDSYCVSAWKDIRDDPRKTGAFIAHLTLEGVRGLVLERTGTAAERITVGNGIVLVNAAFELCNYDTKAAERLIDAWLAPSLNMDVALVPGLLKFSSTAARLGVRPGKAGYEGAKEIVQEIRQHAQYVWNLGNLIVSKSDAVALRFLKREVFSREQEVPAWYRGVVSFYMEELARGEKGSSLNFSQPPERL